MKTRFCQYCGKKLVRKKIKHNQCRRGWAWETPVNFLRRKFCSLSCFGKYNKPEYWTKEKVIQEFLPLIEKADYNLGWLSKNYPRVIWKIYEKWGKNGWRRFLIEIDKKERLKNDFVNPLKKRMARALLRYWKNELGVEKGKVFFYSQCWQLPIEGYEKKSNYSLWQALEYLKKIKKVRLVKKGRRENVGGRNRASQKKASQYVMT